MRGTIINQPGVDMKKAALTILSVISLLTLTLSSGTARKIKISQEDKLIGTQSGLYSQDRRGNIQSLWEGSQVRKILHLQYGVFLLTGQGIIFSSNLIDFESRNKGIRVLTIKSMVEGKKQLQEEIQEIKDLSADPYNPDNLVCSTKDGVYLSTTQGKAWTFYKRPSHIPGIKAVAVYSKPELHVIMAHPFRGIYLKKIKGKNKWENIRDGLFQNFGGPEEISDITVLSNGNRPLIYSANNFLPHLYQLDLTKKSWKTILKTNHIQAGMLESMDLDQDMLTYVTEKGVHSLNLSRTNPAPLAREDINLLVEQWNKKDLGLVNALSIPRKSGSPLELDHLWMFAEPEYDRMTKKALNIRALYLPAYVMRKSSKRKQILSLMKDIKMNGIVIDMKDDLGRLRFKPQDKDLQKMAYVWGPVDLKTMIKDTKKQGIYTIARIVVFKDKHFYHYASQKYAVKDKYTGRSWQGLKIEKEDGVKVTNRIPEFWVDPFSEKVWEYNVKIAQDLIKQGFDEVQFDYIRFPTDGINIYRTQFSHREGHMDKSSALKSFLKYARENIQAPISIDIYGGNGWNRSGTHTGQDVEMIKDYVNAICPMYYPSHFPQDFLSEKPEELRPWRIYYYGTLRNWMIAHKKVTIRPYVQAFKINVSYDRKYYNKDYIRHEIKGVDDALNEGYIYWNAGAKYNILRQVYSTNQTKS